MAIVSDQQSLTQLLRHAKLIAATADVTDLEQWVDLELGGYPENVTPPEYRRFTTSCVEILNPYRGWEFAGDLHEKMVAYMPVEELECLAELEFATSPIIQRLPVANPSHGSRAQRAVAMGKEFIRITGAIKTRLLQWAIELERRGIKGPDMDFNDKDKKGDAPIVNIGKFTGVFGNVHNSQVTLYDYSSVQQLLQERNIPKQDRREFEDILDELKEASPENKPSLLRRGEEWIVRHKELLGFAADAVAKVVGASLRG